MSYFKHVFAKKLTKYILANQEVPDVKHVVAQIAQLIRIQPVKKDATRVSQYFLELSSLSKCLNGKLPNLDQLQSEDNIPIKVYNDMVHWEVEPSKFTQKVLEEIRSNKENYGYTDEARGVRECVCVEYSSPNVAKPFHMGHLRSTIIGNVLSNFYEAAGHDVKRINWIGDWGTQFGLLSLGLMRFGDINLLRQDPLLELFNVYVKINQAVKSECGDSPETTSQTHKEGVALFTQLEEGDDHMRTVWKMVKELSINELNKIYQRLGVHFTHTMAESDYHGKTQLVLQLLDQANLLQYDSKGVGYVKMDIQDIGQASVVKSDGSSLYLTRDIASALERQDQFSFDRVHYVVEQGQRAHFIKLVNILKQLGVPWASRPIGDIHVPFGRVKGMSTRQGNVVFLRDVLDEARTRVLKLMETKSTTRVTEDLETTADIIGVTSIVLQDLKLLRTKDYTFSWEVMLNLKSDSGVFVQYCHARLCSMLANCGVALTEDVDTALLVNDVALLQVVLHLASYPDVFEKSLISLEPHHVVKYMFKLCHLVNVAYSLFPVKGQVTELAQARLKVFECSRQVLANSLTLLGLTPLRQI
ncbi:unnamed protein product [Lymnaea stagnalis]|uniref:Probable arginine--tRNA ligase, mitochondrial n=1 Tax=Lymnaea stagnalis TaxID=6523 RepID=A0AAV2I0U4_LYMST